MPLDQVMARGEQQLSSGNAREALKSFKYLKKEGYDPAPISLCLFKAYLMRYEQLLEKKMMKEAEAEVVLSSAVEFLPTGRDLSPETLKSSLRLLPLEKGVALYGEFLPCNDPLPEMERLIGNRAVLEDSLPLLDTLPGHTALVSQKTCLEKASVCMNAGHWEKALQALKPIPRKSPFSDIKIFAKLMATFAKEDKKGMQKASSLLGKEFPLTSVPALLTPYAKEEGMPSAPGTRETATLLWGNAFLNERHARALKKGVSDNNLLKIKQAATGLATSLPSANRDKAICFLAEMAGQGVMEQTHQPDHVLALFKKMLPSKTMAERLFVKVLAPKDHFFNDLAQEFWKNLDQLFPDKTEENLAKAFFLVEITQALIRNPDVAFSVKDQLNSFFRRIGFKGVIQINDQDYGEGMHRVFLTILSQALALDSENHDAYGLLLQLPLESPALRKALTPLLETMARVFPDDPRPCLRLAKLHSRKSAVRKAETALKEAFRRAPHDGEVLEQYALSHVIASNRQLTVVKYQLAMRDLEAAAGLGVASLGVYIAEKRLLWDLINTRKFSRKVFEALTGSLSPAQTLKVLALFKIDLSDPAASYSTAPRGVQSVFNGVKKQIPELTSREILYLLKPVGEPFKELYHSSDCASWFMDKRGTILTRLDSRDLTGIALDLVANGATDPVIRELGKRMDACNDNTPESIVMAFLHLCLTHIRGDRVNAHIFSSIINSAQEPVKERLRKLSRRLAPIAPGYLRPAYEQFDFSLLTGPFGGGNFPFDINPEAMDEFEEIIEKVMGSSMDEDGADWDDDGDWDDDDSWGDFQVEAVFCKGLDDEVIYDLVFDLMEDAEWILENLKDPDRESYELDFMDSFVTLLGAVRKKGLDSPDAFRKAGVRFARHVPCAQNVLRAFNSVGKASATPASKELLSFILGMRIGF
jgi:tetratricopeptide (TPR) repeat protein